MCVSDRPFGLSRKKGDETVLGDAQYCSDLKSWRPFIFEDIETDSTEFINVGMAKDQGEAPDISNGQVRCSMHYREADVLDLCEKADFWRVHRIFFR